MVMSSLVQSQSHSQAHLCHMCFVCVFHLLKKKNHILSHLNCHQLTFLTLHLSLLCPFLPPGQQMVTVDANFCHVSASNIP